MTTKMNVFITLPGGTDSRALYEELKAYKVNVTDLEKKVFVYTTVDIREPIIEYVLQACYKYGGPEIKVEAKSEVEQKAPK